MTNALLLTLAYVFPAVAISVAIETADTCLRYGCAHGFFFIAW
jgi:hypothetical protein